MSPHVLPTRRIRCVLGPLRREHELARRALRVLDRQAAHVGMGGTLPVHDVDWMAKFFREFFLGVHAAKETRHLCPAVVLHGSDREAELAGTLLAEHDDTSELLETLSLFSAPSADLAEEERAGFVETARTCVSRLTRMMREEETSLFPVALGCLPFDERLSLLEAFEELDEGHRAAASWHRELLELEATWVS